MPAATASGADATPNGAAKNREHNQGNQDRKYTVEQKAAVIRVRKCSHTAFYEILGVEKTVTDGEIKKAYRKLSLLTHPDKNGYDGADEAFKMVSRAFQVLSDADKKAKYDRFGGDPDNRFGPGAASSSPFSGFAQSPAAGGGPMFDAEISPEELFNRFFGGGGLGGGGYGPFGGDMFGGGGGSQFVFNIGGGPGIRVHQFGGGRPRRRPRDANAEADERPQSGLSVLYNLLPLLILFMLPVLSSIFSSDDSTPAGPKFMFDNPSPPLVLQRKTPRYKVDYFIDPKEVEEFTERNYRALDNRVETTFVNDMRYRCDVELQTQFQLRQDAQGWFVVDVEKMRRANDMELKACRRLRDLGIPRSNSY